MTLLKNCFSTERIQWFRINSCNQPYLVEKDSSYCCMNEYCGEFNMLVAGEV